jgi:hypothetical protein
MADESYADLLNRYRAMETDQLKNLLTQPDHAAGESPASQALRAALEGRQERFPGSERPPAKRDKRAATQQLGIESNASSCPCESGKTELVFPRDGFVRPERSTFGSVKEVTDYLGQVLGLAESGGPGHFRIKRKGKYQRLDRSGRPIFTFGDPILDAITDEHGSVTVGREHFNLLPYELAADRRGGISSIDLGGDAVRHDLIREATMANGTRTLVEHTADGAIIASKNPSQLDFFIGSAHMRFRSWKTNYIFYRCIGSEIETWGGNFTSASIESMYADPIVSGNPFICGVTKRDADSDTNDDYVDEYETGVFANPASSVRSFCTALWKGQTRGGTVGKGSCTMFLG